MPSVCCICSGLWPSILPAVAAATYEGEASAQLLAEQGDVQGAPGDLLDRVAALGQRPDAPIPDDDVAGPVTVHITCGLETDAKPFASLAVGSPEQFAALRRIHIDPALVGAAGAEGRR